METKNKYTRNCINCKNWRVAMQTLICTKGVCDVSYGCTWVDKNFSCGKFEPTKQLLGEMICN